jgi:hypothetical protein
MVSARQQFIVSAAAAAVLLAVSGAMAFLAEDQYEEQVTLEEKLVRSENEAHNALAQARESVALAEHVSARYQALERSGLFEAIDKPRAIDRAEAILQPYIATVARYQVGGSHETAPSPLAPAGRYQIDIQRVAVDFEPLHEERFLDVWGAIAGLRGPAGGIESCDLQRPTAEAMDNGITSAKLAPLKAHCLLTWYRLQAAPVNAVAPAGATPAATETRKDS